jgi:DNA-binding protein HU-beta
MTKADLISIIQSKAGLDTKAAAGKALDATLEALGEALANGEAITLVGFGTFKVSERAARTGRNPRTGQEIQIPAAKTVKFSPGKRLKDAVS